MKTFKFKGETFEQGANWITGLKKDQKENPIWKLAQEYQLKGEIGEQSCGVGIDKTYCLTQNGEDVTEHFDQSVKKLNQASDLIDQSLGDTFDLKEDLSMKEALH